MKFKIKSRNSVRISDPYPIFASASTDPEKATVGDEESTDQATQATSVQAPAPLPTLKVKKVDHFYSRWSKKWKYQNSGSNVIPELRPLPSDGKDDPWQEFCFVIVREIPNDGQSSPYFKFVIKSPYLLKACKDVIGEVQGVSWNAIPLEVSNVVNEKLVSRHL